MNEIFGIPTHLLAVTATGALAAVLLALAVLAWRRPLLMRLGVRAVPRRRLRTVLIVLGLTTSTAVITTAIGTGETMATTLRSVVAGGIGPVDEVIMASGRTPPSPSLTNPRAVLAGEDLAAGSWFAQGQWERLRPVAAEAGAVSFEPAAQVQATAISPDQGRAATGVNVLGLNPGAAVFDGFSGVDGGTVSLGDLQPGEVLINAQAGALLGIEPGGTLALRLPRSAFAAPTGAQPVGGTPAGAPASTGSSGAISPTASTRGASGNSNNATPPPAGSSPDRPLTAPVVPNATPLSPRPQAAPGAAPPPVSPTATGSGSGSPVDPTATSSQAGPAVPVTAPPQPGGAQSAAEPETQWRVRAVIRDGGLAGVQPAVLVPLATLQGELGRPDQINQILVANRPGRDPEKVSREVTGRLRMALMDREVLARAAAGLAGENGQGQLRALEGRIRPEARPVVQRLRDAARAGRPTPDLAYFLADPLLLNDYRWVLAAAANDPALRGRDGVERLAPLTVLEVKQRATDAANEYGSAVTTVFLILGLFSIAASLLLVFLIFVMLAAERRTEMGLSRAVGVQRWHLTAAFGIEGLVYDLAAAVLGLALGIGVGAMVVRLTQRVFDRFLVSVEGQLSLGGMLLSFSLGALVTFVTVLVAAWRVSRVNIIAAISGAPEGRGSESVGAVRRRRLLTTAAITGSVGGGALLIALSGGQGPLLAAGGSLLLAAIGIGIGLVLVRMGQARLRVNRLLATMLGPAIAILFARSPASPPSVHHADVVRSGTAGFVLAGVVMALCLVWAAGANLDVLLAPLRALSRRAGALAPATRIAVAYPLTHPFRTALTAAMFALVVLTMVTATVLLRSTEAAYVRRDGGAGFDIRAQFAQPPAGFSQTLADSRAVRTDDFTTIGAQAQSAVEALWPDPRVMLWRPTELRAADEALLTGLSGELLARADGYRDDAEVWQALRTQAGPAIIARRDAELLPDVRAALARATAGGLTFPPTPVWVRDPRGGPALRLLVIGVAGDGSVVGRGLLTSRASVSGMPVIEQPPAEYFLRVRDEALIRTAATGLQLTFPEGGLRTRILGEEARTGHAVRNLLDALIRGFLGIGLASGIAALGVIGMRSVAERRQQIGMLRALGFSRRSVEASFLIEGSVVAVLGITAGAVVGLVLAQNVVVFLARDFRELRLLIPWWQVLALTGAAYAAALVSALAVAWQAGRVAPAEALRYE